MRESKVVNHTNHKVAHWNFRVMNKNSREKVTYCSQR